MLDLPCLTVQRYREAAVLGQLLAELSDDGPEMREVGLAATPALDDGHAVVELVLKWRRGELEARMPRAAADVRGGEGPLKASKALACSQCKKQGAIIAV